MMVVPYLVSSVQSKLIVSLRCPDTVLNTSFEIFRCQRFDDKVFLLDFGCGR